MRKDLSAIGLGMVLSCAAVFSGFAAGPVTSSLRGHVPAAVSSGTTQPNGHLVGDQQMNLALGLPLRNREGLTNLLQQIYDPSSPMHGHYLTPEQFTEKFGPTREDYQKVIEFAQKNGLTVTGTHPNRMILDVAGKVSDVEAAFRVNLNRYQHPSEDREFFAPDREPTINAAVPILRVGGLDNYFIPRPHSKLLSKPQPQPQSVKPLAAKPGATPHAGSGFAGSYRGADFRNAYVPGTTLTGAGQNVGLLQFDGFFASDIAAYEAQIGLVNPPNIIVVPIDGGVPAPTPIGDGEVSLDIEMVLSMSPGVSNIYVYEAPNPSPWEDLLNRMANDNLAKQLSCSWGGGPPDPVAEQIFQEMALQGQSFFDASGDSDAFLPGELIPFPGESPHITQVGGTTLTTGPGAAYASEIVWNWGLLSPLDDGVGSCGGISSFYTIPSWQTNINFTLSKGSSVNRNIPDVALTGDNVDVFYGGGFEGIFGGTSCAAPLWAGFTALANQQSAASSQPPLGFLNPALYTIAKGPNYANCFHDTTNGNNTWSQSPTQFFAVSNYDLCTGLGTPNGTNLINALVALGAAPIHISPPPAPYGTNLSAVSGGNPNGTWSLFVQDDSPIKDGQIANGWVLSLTTADVVGTEGDLEVLMTTTNSTVFTGQAAAFVVTVTNYGPSISTNVVLSDSLPLGVTILSTNASVGTVTRNGATLTWNVGTLANGAGARLVVVARSSTVGTMANFASADAGTPDPNPDEDSASATVNVIAPTVTLTPTLTSGGGGQTLQISVPSPAGLTVVIQANSNLIGSNWVNVYTNTPPFIFTDPSASSYLYRFYRAQIVLP
jgi:uncharacterized repeat protein (TIGR01451 family)